MKTFEEEFNRSPTQEDFAIQKHTLEVVEHLLSDELTMKGKIGLQEAIDRIGIE